MARGAFDASFISEKARKDLLALLESVPGKKNLVIQQSLVGRIELLVKYATLQEYGVDHTFLLERDNVDSSQKHVVFLAQGERPKQISAVADQVKRLRQDGQVDHEFHVYWMPRRTLVSNSLLENAGILGEISPGEYPLYFQSLEHDLLSLELDESFGDLYLSKDPTSVFTSARALMLIQQSHGLFPRLLGKGDHAAQLITLLARMREENAAELGSSVNGVPRKSNMPSSDLDSLIVIDREVDFTSPLLTQLTYEGLIDESFTITHSQAELDTSITGASGSSSDPKNQPSGQQLKRKVKLDGNDKLYSSLRDANFAIVGSLLNRVARRLQSDYEERHGQKSVGELKDFVSKLPGYQAEHQSLKIHTSLAEEILKRTRNDIFRKSLEVQQNIVAGADISSVLETIEDLIARDAPITTVLRLLCLVSINVGGIRQREYDSVRRQVVQAYGYQHMLTLDALEKMHLLQPRAGGGAFTIPGTSGGAAVGGKTDYASLRRQLDLVMDDVSEQDPKDIAYVFSGYAPLSVRLVQCILQKPYISGLRKASASASLTSSVASDASQGWKGFEDILKNVKGKTVHEIQSSNDRASKARQVLEGRGGKKTTVVFFLGGITFAEIAALRFIAKQEEEKRNLVICTTSLLSGEKMMRAALETSEVTKN